MSASFQRIAWNSAIALAELAPLERVPARRLVGALRQPDRQRGDADAAGIEHLHRLQEALRRARR